MKGKFTFRHVSMVMLLLSSQLVQAKVWRINNNVGSAANFSQIAEAMSNPSVLAGDTIYLEASAATYTGANFTKKLVVIGPGYFLSGNDGNTGLQYNPNSATITLYIDSTASGSKFYGLTLTANMDGGADDLLFERCLVTFNTWSSGRLMNNMKINKCYVTNFRIGTYVTENMEITNSVIENSFSYVSGNNILFRNNIVNTVVMTISNAYVTNTIFYGGSFTFNSCTVKNNISTGNTLPAGNDNRNNVPAVSIFVTSLSRDGKWQLLPTSPARGTGETINGVTPDLGIFGTDDPYRLSGIPPVPSIYALSVPSSVPATATNMNITVSTRSNN
ncbi:MAG: hypothetical protein ACTHMC_18140 [Pseudobacter sp.]|uniref:hypothetical protein n=1 Tax=Pseudobacter sp. TaxID=2045420 RepID=UPI003F81458D